MTRICWTLPERQLDGVTVLSARDLVVECFFEAQRETFERAKQRVGASTFDEGSVRVTVTGAVRIAFKEIGGDFDRPTRRSLASTIEVLARKAIAWGTPEDVVAHHRAEVQRVLAALALAR
jgi:hypothetical protein